MSVIINASTSSGLVQTADTSGTLELQSNGTTQLTVSSTGTYGQLKSGTAKAYNWNGLTTNTYIDFDTIPSWAKRITVVFSGVSTNGTNNLIVQLGSGSLTTSSYVGSHIRFAAAAIASASWAGSGIEFAMPVATYEYSGSLVLTKISSDIWVANGFMGSTNNAYGLQTGGNTANLGGALTQLRITTIGTTNTFDAGSINILYEG